ncbi:MAG: SUMF1/EgtB/PvdO family nonheme iron enzyme [bacterium]|nr:SUMF1/EgtB/PvdO family nonheme iron enzyme [bacterium]
MRRRHPSTGYARVAMPVAPCRWRLLLLIASALLLSCTGDMPQQPRRDNPFDPLMGREGDPFQFDIHLAGDSLFLNWAWPPGVNLDGARLYQSFDGQVWTAVQDMPPPVSTLRIPLDAERRGRWLSLALTALAGGAESSLDNDEVRTRRTPPLLVAASTGSRYCNQSRVTALVRCADAVTMKVAVGNDSATALWQTYAPTVDLDLPAFNGWHAVSAWFRLPDDAVESILDSLALDTACAIAAASWEPLSGASAPLRPGDALRLHVQLEHDFLGAEIGARVVAYWPGQADSLLLADRGDGHYQTDYSINEDFWQTGQPIEIHVWDRAGNRPTPLTLANPLVTSRMILVPAGTFTMGQTGVAVPTHEVTLTRSFLLDRTEVTNEQYRVALQWAYNQGLVTLSGGTVQAYGVNLLYMNDADCLLRISGGRFSIEPVTRGSHAGSLGDQHPVNGVTWFGAASYCDWRSMMAGLEPYYQGLWNQIPGSRSPYAALGCRLPTEAEWEHAARFNDGRTYPWGNGEPTCNLANTLGCVNGTGPVGSKPDGDSALGFQDMAGNVWEWTNDFSSNYVGDDQVDPVGAVSGTDRVVRGGGWYSNSSRARCAYRSGSAPANRYTDIGFRCARTP